MRKTIHLTILCLLIEVVSYAQHTEYSFTIGTGFYHYATNDYMDPYYSMINTILLPSPGFQPYHSTYANNPYGNKSGFSYTLSVGKKR